MPRLIIIALVAAVAAQAVAVPDQAAAAPVDLERDQLAGAAVVMAGGIGIGFVLGLLYASQRRRPVPATLYRVASKDVDAAGLADLALAEVV